MSKHAEAKKETKELAPAPKAGALTVANPAPSTAETSSRDELFPVARLIQAMSKQESCQNPNGPDFQKGDVVVYPKRVKIADYKNPFSVIFLRNTLEWANFEVVGAKEEWRSEERRSDKPWVDEAGVSHPENESWPFEYTLDGKKMKRYRQITLYVLLADQAELFIKDAASDAPTGAGSIAPVAIKVRNYSYRVAQEILDAIAGKDFQFRNATRVQMGKEPIPVYAYEHIIQPVDKTNPKGTFQVLVGKGVKPVRSPEIKDIAAKLHAVISRATKLETVQMEETQASTGGRGEYSDEV